MDKTKLEELIAAYKEDLSEAIATRDSIANENLEDKIDAELAAKRKEIADRVYSEHDCALVEANSNVDLMQKIIHKREDQLAELVANEQVEIEETIEEGV